MRIVICITGMPGSGKSSAAAILARRGFTVVSLRKEVEDMMNRMGIGINAQTMRDFSLRLKRRRGSHILAVGVVRSIRKAKGDVVVDGIRDVTELRYIRERAKNARVFLIAVTAARKARYARMLKRARNDDISNYAEFKTRERKEEELGVRGAMMESDFVVSNSGSPEQLRLGIIRVLGMIKRNAINK